MRSALQNKLYRDKLPETERCYKKQRNYTRKLIKKEKISIFQICIMNNYTNTKKFWNTVKPLFSNYVGGLQMITHVKDDKIISDDKEVAEIFNGFFINSVESLVLKENNLTFTGNLINPVMIAMKRFENHPSIIDIKENVCVEDIFSFSKVGIGDIELEVKSLKTNQAGMFMGIPSKPLKQVIDIIGITLMQIWNNEVIDNQKFPTKLKHADIAPIFKKPESILMKNYRPVNILPVVSKIFERIMQKEMITCVNTYLSPYLCGYRKGYNAQYYD